MPFGLGFFATAGAGGLSFYINQNLNSGTQYNAPLANGDYVASRSGIFQLFSSAGVQKSARTLSTGVTVVGNDKATGQIYVSSQSGTTNYLTKIDETGTIVWSRSTTLGQPAGNGKIRVLNGRVYSCVNWWDQGTATNFSAAVWHLAVDGTGSQLMYANQSSPYNDDKNFDVVRDSSGNFYIVGRYTEGNDETYRMVIHKFNSSYVRQWSYKSSDASNNGAAAHGAVISSDGFLYVVRQLDRSDVLLKINISGATPSIVWQRAVFDSNATSDRGWDPTIAIDESNNVYMTYIFRQGVHLIKYDSSGTVVWERNIRSSSTDAYNNNFSINYADLKQITGNWSFNGNVNDGFLFSLPATGAFTGSWTFNGYTITIDATSKTTTNPTTTLNVYTPNSAGNGSQSASTSSPTWTNTTDTWTIRNY